MSTEHSTEKDAWEDGPCDCADCAAGPDIWCCRQCHSLSAGRHIPPAECVCPPDFCLGTDSDSGMRTECAACLALDPELPCLRDIPPGAQE